MVKLPSLTSSNYSESKKNIPGAKNLSALKEPLKIKNDKVEQNGKKYLSV